MGRSEAVERGQKGIGKFKKAAEEKKNFGLIQTVTTIFLFLLVVLLLTVPSAAGGQNTNDSAQKSEMISGDAQSNTSKILIAQTTQPEQPKAQEPAKAQEPSGKWISSGKDLGKWWVGRAKKQPQIPPELLYHLEMDYSYALDTGTEEEEQHKITSNLWLRKNIVTSVTMFSWKEKQQNRMNSLTGRRKIELNEFIYAELWDWIDLAGGLIWTRDSRRYIDNRYFGVGGLYFTFFETPRFVLKAGAYYGYMETHYMQDSLIEARLYPEPKYMRLPFDDYKSDILYFAQRFSLKLTDSLTFSENAGYRYELDDTDFYHWRVKFDLNYQFSKHFSLFAAYEIDYDSNQVDKATSEQLSQIGLEIEARETELRTGFRLNF